MRIGIIGSGNIGSTLARLAVGAGFDVVITNSRGPESLQDLVAELGARAQAGTPDDVGARSDLIVEAVPFGRLHELPSDAIGSGVLVTAANYFAQRDGPIELDGSQSESVARLFPQARVVKAFNAIRAADLASQGAPALPDDERRAIPIAGDDAEAKQIVASFIRAIGFGPLDLGPLAAGAVLEPGGPLFGVDLSVAEVRERLGERLS
jgi:8-hydroxy-5-deazaflavin:NADPH oxidoreductase